MPVMKQLNVGGTTYDTVGEASVTAVINSGTKIATVSIDGTSTDLYAPSGGSSVEPATDAPIVDGTAAVGTSAKYAREDHVHPTDTSRAASTHDHGSITNAGAITSDTAAASGDKLVIADNSDSSKLKRSGIAFGSSTSTFLRNDGTWATPSGGGGGGSWTDVTSAWASVNPDASYLTAMTDGTFVYVSGVTDSADVTIPIGYEALDYHVGVAFDLNDLFTDAIVAEASVPAGMYRASGTQNSFSFSIIYPIATS